MEKINYSYLFYFIPVYKQFQLKSKPAPDVIAYRSLSLNLSGS